MNDIHQKAMERAQQRSGAPQADDTAFASERERAKEALRAEMNSFNGQNVTKISAFTQGDTSDRKLRVAAYCRVSTDDEDQVISMELQKKNFRELITGTGRPFCGISFQYVKRTDAKSYPVVRKSYRDIWIRRMGFKKEKREAVTASHEWLVEICLTMRLPGEETLTWMLCR